MTSFFVRAYIQYVEKVKICFLKLKSISGPMVLLIKIARRLKKYGEFMVFLIIGLPLAGIIIALKPIKDIQIALVHNARIGATLSLYYNLCDLAAMKPKRFPVGVFHLNGLGHCNLMWKKILAEKIPFIPEIFGQAIWKALQLSKKGKYHCLPQLKQLIDYNGMGDYRSLWLNPNTLSNVQEFGPKIFHLSEPDIERGALLLKEHGINPNNFICIANRDAAYLKTLRYNQNFDYHNYRNFSIQNFELTARAFADKGYSVVRIGNVVEEPLNLGHENIFDYATSEIVSDLLDIFLMSRCKFGLFPDGGVNATSEMCFRPMLVVNFTAFMVVPAFNRNGKIIFQKFKKMDEDSFLPYRKVLLDYPIMELQSTGEWSKFNLETVTNTDQEILSASLELEDLVDGKFQTDSIDQKLQQSFWNMIGKPYSQRPNFQVATSFLKSNRHLFE